MFRFLVKVDFVIFLLTMFAFLLLPSWRHRLTASGCTSDTYVTANSAKSGTRVVQQSQHSAERVTVAAGTVVCCLLPLVHCCLLLICCCCRLAILTGGTGNRPKFFEFRTLTGAVMTGVKYRPFYQQ